MNPVRSNYNYDYPLICSCNLTFLLEMSNTTIDESYLSKYSCYDCSSSMKQSIPINSNTTIIPTDESQLPNKALLSFIILLGTCFISVALKRFRRSKFFGRTVRTKKKKRFTIESQM